MDQPDEVFTLTNPDLREISGLGPTDSAGVYCAISDEKGIVFFIDVLNGGHIVRQVAFRDKGDFEGIEMVGGVLYALKSDGKLFEIDNWKDPAATTVQEYHTPLKKKDNMEGLCYDPMRESLLLASKGNPDSNYLRNIYAFPLQTKQLNRNPVYQIDPLEVNRLLPWSAADKQRFFSPAGIAIHPLTGDVYVISTSLKRMVVLDYKTGRIRMAVRLDRQVMPQPEGISFDPEGNMYICSEGKKGLGMIFKFTYHPSSR
jgi:uncharacterized protein YjiK